MLLFSPLKTGHFQICENNCKDLRQQAWIICAYLHIW